MISLGTPMVSGAFTYLILLVMAVELLVISTYHIVTKKGIRPIHAMANLGAGAAIVVALGLVVEGAAGQWVVLALLLSMLIHWVDLVCRWNNNIDD